MALWTPYAEETALDLSVKCKQETITDYGYNYQTYVYPNTVSPNTSIPYPQYMGYPQPMYVPIAETSPISSCSSYLPPAISPQLRTGMISPPESPVSHDQNPRRPSYMADVDMLSDDPDFQAFERDALRAMAEKNGGTLLGNNPRMRRAVQTSQAADDSYRKQRERNNFAAKQSRDRRKLREIHLALKVTYLKSEMAKLKAQLATRTCVRCQQSCLC
ncbi:uncharacterized protein [Epargyreus clarus]|uniref:uncharacterized protein n=1 Tax=Epargyreus clarus TaxID=520877 RepID=UPI003C2E4C74